MVDSTNVSDIVFPSGPEDLVNFTAADMNSTAQITIPAEAVGRLAEANRTTSEAVLHNNTSYLFSLVNVSLLEDEFADM